MQIARRPLFRRSRRPSSTAGFVFVSLPRLNTGNNEGSISGLHPSLAPVGLWVTRHPRARLFCPPTTSLIDDGIVIDE